jgi:hypothetical protein
LTYHSYNSILSIIIIVIIVVVLIALIFTAIDALFIPRVPFSQVAYATENTVHTRLIIRHCHCRSTIIVCHAVTLMRVDVDVADAG